MLTGDALLEEHALYDVDDFKTASWTPGAGGSGGRRGPRKPTVSDFCRLLSGMPCSATIMSVRVDLNAGAAPIVEPWLSVEDVAKHLDVAKDSIYQRIEHHRLPAHKIGRLWKSNLSEVDEWVRAGGANVADEKGGYV